MPVALEGKLPTVLVVVLLELAAGEPGNNGREVPAAAAGERAGGCAGKRGREEEGSGVEEEGAMGLRGKRGCTGRTEEGEGAFRDGTEF